MIPLVWILGIFAFVLSTITNLVQNSEDFSLAAQRLTRNDIKIQNLVTLFETVRRLDWKYNFK